MNISVIMAFVYIVSGIGGFYYKYSWRNTPQAKQSSIKYYYPIMGTIFIIIGLVVLIKHLLR